jgi:hypothetical protein
MNHEWGNIQDLEGTSKTNTEQIRATVHRVCLKTSAHFNLGGFTRNSSSRNDELVSEEVSR